MVYGRLLYWYSWTGLPEDRGRDFIPPFGVEPDRLFAPPGLLPALLRNQIVTSTNGLLRRDVVEKVGGYEASFPGLHEDQAFAAKVCLSTPVFVASRCWYRYRRHEDSCCAVAERTGAHLAKRLSYLAWLKRYLSEKGVKDPGVWQAVETEVWKSRHPTRSHLKDASRYRAAMMK